MTNDLLLEIADTSWKHCAQCTMKLQLGLCRQAPVLLWEIETGLRTGSSPKWK